MSEVFVFMGGRFLLMDHFTKFYEELAPRDRLGIHKSS